MRNNITFLGLLALVFIALKLTHAISWSWWWVLLPLYGPMVIGIGMMVFGMAGLLITAFIMASREDKARKKIKETLERR